MRLFSAVSRRKPVRHFNTSYYPSPHFPPSANGHLAGKEATPACEMLRLEPFFRDAYIKISAHISERSRKVLRFAGLVYSFVGNYSGILNNRSHGCFSTALRKPTPTFDLRSLRILWDSLWNPVGVRCFLSISTQCALRDTGLWSGTALQFILV